MAEPKAHEKTLEMRVAELEDKLSKVHVTEEEMKAYHKVSALMGAQPSAGLSPRVCVIANCIIYQPCARIAVCTHCSTECTGVCSPCQQFGGGGFGTLGG